MFSRALVPKRTFFARLARATIGLGSLVASAAIVFGFVPLSTALTRPVASPNGLGGWWFETLAITFACYLFTCTSAVIIGALLGGLTAKRGLRLLRPRWYNGAIRRGLELTGAVPSVIFAAIWVNSHPGHALPAVMVVTLVQQVFEIGARVKSMIESPSSTWNDLWYEFSKCAGQAAVMLASGEIALVALNLTAPNYATWPSSAATYLFAGDPGASPTLLLLALSGTLGLPACLFLAGPTRPAAR